MDEHLRRRDVHCAVAPLLEQNSAVTWSVLDGAEVDAGQTLGTTGLIERGNLHQLIAPCHGKLRIRALDDVQRDVLVATTTVPGAADSADGSSDSSDANSSGNSEAGDSAAAESRHDDKDAAAGTREPAATTTTAAAATIVVASVEYCIHPLKNGRTCMMCLAVVDENEDEMDGERRSVSVISHGQVLRLNIEEAKKFDSDNIRRQLSAKKLSLVLDLDHTLLHAVRVADVVDTIAKTDDTFFFYIPGMNGQQHVVKLRPGLQTFLRELAALYDLFIYTHGTRLYAEQIARIIDPTGAFFQHRIVARTDTPDMVHKSLKLLFPSSDDSMILVLDDRIDVWKENEGNVFLIEPYHFFKCTAEINNAAGKGIGGGAGDESSADTDTHLTHATNVLKQVHKAFYDDHSVTVEEQMAGSGRDVKTILGEQKRSVLKGCNIVFSGVFPISGQRGPESHYLWRLALDLGARPSMTMTDFPITHLVIHPGRLGTQKHVQAKATPSVFVVTPEWIFKCARTWERVAEADFLADEWKAKQERLAVAAAEAERATQAERPVTEQPPAPVASVGATSDSAADATEPSPTPESAAPIATTTTEPLGAPSADATSSGVSVDSVDATAAAAAEAATKKMKKSVSFAASVPGGDDGDGETNTPSSSTRVVPSAASLRQRRAPVRRVIGGARVGGVHIPERKGVVASGGTFDFLAKITQIGAATRELKPVEAPLQPPGATTSTKPVASQPALVKDVDDAFLRLIEAEERENAVESKRKLESDNVKDMLSARRLKKPKTLAPVLARVSSEDDDDDDDDLDDLEADILDDL